MITKGRVKAHRPIEALKSGGESTMILLDTLNYINTINCL
jgi:hypothetical protein